MKFLNKARIYWGEKIIHKYRQDISRNAVVCSIQNAKSIGIVFNATHQISFEIVKDLVKNLTTKKNEIDVLGFVDSKQLIDHYLYRKGFDFFTRKQLNWYSRPETENVKLFIEKPYDLLLNLSLDEPYPILYILAFSKAKFKAGIYGEGRDFLDFMIDIEKEKEAMNELRLEIEKELKKQTTESKELEQIIDEKAETEIQLNFLINQLVHYLSIIKN